MGFRVSPGVDVTEQSVSLVAPAVGTTEGGFAGHFQWGPVEEIINLANEVELVDRVHIPDANTFTSFFTIANFLQYTGQARLVRASADGMRNAIANSNATSVMIKNRDHYDNQFASGANTYGMWAAKYPGDLGNGLKVSIFYSSDTALFAAWIYNGYFHGAPVTSDYVSTRGGTEDGIHIVVVDALGKFSGAANTVLERFGYASKASDAKNSDGTSNYYKDVVNRRSKYIWWLAHPDAGTGPANSAGWGVTANGTTFSTGNGLSHTVTLSKGVIATPAAGNTINGFSKFVNANEVDVALLMTGDHNASVVNYAVQSVAEIRKDAVVFASPTMNNVVNNAGNETTDVITYRNTLPTSTYAFMDCNWKYQYDRYNDVYRWVPLNGDVAGLAARTDLQYDPWFSIAGYTRGQIKNVFKLAWNPSEANIKDLYRSSVNAIIIEKGEGPILFGDKTLVSKPDAFDRINVRRLFIILEKSIAKAAKYFLFDINDQYTRAQFVSMVEPFLRNIQGRRGIFAFQVICDETNNTPDVIDRNEFVGSIRVKPARSINFIRLNFTAVGTGVSFEEVVG